MSPDKMRRLLAEVATGMAVVTEAVAVIAEKMVVVADALPSGEAHRPDEAEGWTEPTHRPTPPAWKKESAQENWFLALTMPEHPDLDVSIEESGPVQFWARRVAPGERSAGLVHVRDVLRAELVRLDGLIGDRFPPVSRMVEYEWLERQLENGDDGPSLRAKMDRIWVSLADSERAALNARSRPTSAWIPEREDTFDELERIWSHAQMGRDVRDLRIELADGGFVCECCRRTWAPDGWPIRCPLCSGALPGQACESCKSEGGNDTRPERHTRRVLIWIDAGSDRELRREWRERRHG